MLQQNAQPQNKFPMVESFWTEEEWEKIALELKSRHPKKNFTNYFSDIYTLQEFEDAAEEVILQERQRSFKVFQDVRKPLFHAFERLKGAKPSPKALAIPKGGLDQNGNVKWSPYEWDEVVLELHRLAPGAFENRLATIRCAQINEAVKIFEQSRQRYFNVIDMFRIPALKAWDALTPEMKDPNLQERPIVDFANGPVMAPPKRKTDDSSQMATAIQKAFTEPAKVAESAKSKQKRIHWSADDWLLIAREMYRQDPLNNLLTSTFPRFDKGALKAAQRKIFPREKQRNFSTSNGIKRNLIAAFATLRKEIEDKKTQPERVQELKERIQGVTVAPAEPAEVAAEPVKAEAPIAASRPTIGATPTEMDFYGKVLNAAVPLMNVLIEEVVKRLAPSLVQACLPAMEIAIKEVMRSAMPVYQPTKSVQLTGHTTPQSTSEPLGPLSKQELAQYLPTPAEKPKKLKIALLMPGGAQREQMRVAFPEYEFVFIDHGQGIKEAGQNCVLFIAVDAYVNIGNRKNIREHVSVEKLRYVDGGLSSIKRMINIWKADQK